MSRDGVCLVPAFLGCGGGLYCGEGQGVVGYFWVGNLGFDASGMLQVCFIYASGKELWRRLVGCW